MSQKAQSSRELTAQEFINAEAIENNLLYTTDKMLFAFIRVRGHDNSLLGDTEHSAVTEQLTVALSEEAEPLQILSVPRTVDTEGMIGELKELRLNTDNDARLKLVNGEISALEELAEDGAKEPLILLKIWKAAAPNADRALLDRAALLMERLSNNQISAVLLNDAEILRLCSIYAELGIWQETDTHSDIPYLKGKNRVFSRKPTPEQQAHAELLEQITPIGGLFFQPTNLMVGSRWCRCYGVTRYPAEVDYGWAVKLTNATDCITCITYYPGRANEIGDALSRSIRSSSRDAAEERDARKRKRYERKATDADRLIDDLDAKSMALGHMSIVVMPFGDSKEALEDACKNVLSRFSVKRMKLKVLSWLQKEAFRHISPYYPNQPHVDDIIQRIIPLETLVGGYPFTINTLRDDHGIYFARTPDRGILSLDIRHRDLDRTNGNGIVTGIPGTGKSTMLKHLIESMYMQGMKIIIIDPEREYRDLCKNLGGTWLDAGGGYARNNLLQIQAPAKDDEGELRFQSEFSPLSQHIQYVQMILQYKLPSLTDTQQSLLERALRELYDSHGINLSTPWENDLSDRPNNQYPIMEDLYRLLLSKAKEDPRYDDLALLIESMAIGADSVIWNGHTNIDFQNDLVVLDTYQLYNSTDKNRSAKYYSLLRLAFTVASMDRQTPYLIVADEAQTIFDPSLSGAAAAMKNIALRIRKYEGYLWLAFHSLQELLDDRIRMDGQPIVDAASYKILFGTDGRNLADTVSLFKLTPAEEKALNARQRKKALALIGSQHLKVEFELPSYKLELMGKGGGR